MLPFSIKVKNTACDIGLVLGAVWPLRAVGAVRVGVLAGGEEWIWWCVWGLSSVSDTHIERAIVDCGIYIHILCVYKWVFVLVYLFIYI